MGPGGNGGMLAGARLPMKQRKPAHSSANKLGGHQSSGLGRGGETSGISMSVDSGEGESLGDKVSPSGGRCHSSDRQVRPLLSAPAPFPCIAPASLGAGRAFVEAANSLDCLGTAGKYAS